MQFHELMQRLGVELGLGGLQPDASGACAVRLDDVTVRFLDVFDDAFTCQSRLGRIDDHDTLAQESLLRGNLFADGVGGSALALDAEGAVYLTQRLRIERLAFPAFIACLDRFVSVADYWSRYLAAGRLPQLAD